VLGSGAFGARSFAASWATERGVVPRRRTRRGTHERTFALATVVTLAAVATIVASVAILASDSGSRLAQVGVLAPPPFQEGSPDGRVLRVSVTPPDLLIWATPEPGFDSDPIGWTLLVVGLVGTILPLLLWWSWAGARPPAAHG
jgi:hypothetical protein